MSRFAKITSAAAVLLALSIPIVWMNRAEMVLGIIEFAVPRAMPVGPNLGQGQSHA